MLQGSGLHETIKVVQAQEPKSHTETVNLYNNLVLASATTNGIDTLGFEEAMVVINLGVIGADGTTFTVMSSQTPDANHASLANVTDTAGTVCAKTVVDADDNKTFVLRFKCNEKKRYVFIKSLATGATAQVYGVNVLLGKPKSEPVTQLQTVAFADTI